MDKDTSVIFLGGFFPPEIYSEITTNSKGIVQNAADALQKSLISGLGSQLSNFEVLNIPYLGSYPLRYKKLFTPKEKSKYLCYNTTITCTTYGYCNLTGYKYYSIYKKTKKALNLWYENNTRRKKVIIIYALFVPFLKAAVSLKIKNPNIKIIQIVPDLPEYMSSRQGSIRNYIKKISNDILHKLEKEVTGFVLLSKYMTEKLPINLSRCVIVEGICDENYKITPKALSKDNNYILYTGTLAERYGIMKLIEAFTKISRKDIKLIICGLGDCENHISKIAKENNRIVFLGQLPREKVLELQQKALLLVNPRTSEGEYTKYSFPSKTMEYLASGTPTLMYRLPGIPEEYYKYFFSPKDESIESLKEKMDEILSIDTTILIRFGEKAQNFVLNKKNPKMQTKKIIELINQL